MYYLWSITDIPDYVGKFIGQILDFFDFIIELVVFLFQFIGVIILIIPYPVNLLLGVLTTIFIGVFYIKVVRG